MSDEATSRLRVRMTRTASLLGLLLLVGLVAACSGTSAGTSAGTAANGERPLVNSGLGQGDHWHVTYSIYVCVADGQTSVDRGGSDPTSLASDDVVPGQPVPPLADVQNDTVGIHTHRDGVIHVHPFVADASGRGATLDKFLTQVGAGATNDTLTLPTGDGAARSYQEGVTKCRGGKDGVLKVALWDTAAAAARGDRPDEVITSNFDSIRLKDGQALSISFLPDGSQLPIETDVAQRLEALTDISPRSSSSSP